MVATTTGQHAPARTPVERNGRTAMGILVYLGLSLQLLQVGIIPLLKPIGESVGSSESTTSWLVTAGLISGAVLLAVLSRVADLIGKKPVILIALALVLVGSLIGCFADSFGGLLVARILMGGVLPMLALPEALASDTMSPLRAHQSIGAIHAGTGVGVGLGLVLGAFAAGDGTSWRAYFVVGAIASAVGILAVVLGVNDSTQRAPGHLDVPGAVLLAAGLAGVLLALTEGPTWGWGSARVLASLLVGLGLLVVWWINESRVAEPLIDVRRLLSPAIRSPYAITFLAAMGIYSALSAVTRLAQTPSATGAGYGWTPHMVAWYGVPEVIGAVLGAVIIRPFLKAGRRIAVAGVGVGCLIATFVVLGPFVDHASATMIACFVDAIGLTLVLASCQIIVLRAVPIDESGIAVGLSIVVYAVGNSVGNAIAAALFSGYTTHAGAPSLTGYRLSFLVSGVAAVLALGLCVQLGVHRRRRYAGDAPGSGVPLTGPATT